MTLQRDHSEDCYRVVLPELDNRQLSELAYKHRNDESLRNALVTLLALKGGQTREQIFNALADLVALRQL